MLQCAIARQLQTARNIKRKLQTSLSKGATQAKILKTPHIAIR